MSLCASGSIQVVTNVARFRIGSPSRVRSSETSRNASMAGIPTAGRALSGTASTRNLFP